jgi:hypothetical protein
MSNPSPPATGISRASRRAIRRRMRIDFGTHAATSQKISAAIRFLAPEPALPTASSQLPAPDSMVLLTNGIGGMARLCVDLGPREFQIRLRARREPEPDRAGGPPHFRQTHPRLGQRRRFSLAARFQKSRFVPSRFARRLEFCGERRRRPHGGNPNCAPKCSAAKTRRFFISAARPKSSRTENNCPPTPTCA